MLECYGDEAHKIHETMCRQPYAAATSMEAIFKSDVRALSELARRNKKGAALLRPPVLLTHFKGTTTAIVLS